MRLRPLHASDIERLAWLPALAQKTGYQSWASNEALVAAIEDDREAEGVRPQLVLCIDEGGASGIIEYEIGAPIACAARVHFLAIDPSRWRLGIGGRAALALERRLRRSAERVYVSVPPRLGLTLYFWLRLGYRPLTRPDWPVEPEDAPSVWMMRELR